MIEHVLVVDDDPIGRDYLAEALSELGLTVDVEDSGDAAVARLRQQGAVVPDLIFTDLQMPGGHDGLGVLAVAKSLDPSRPVVLATAHGTMHVAVEAMRRGADDILEKPVAPQDLELALTRARDRTRLERENRFLRRRSIGDEMLTVSPAMLEVRRLIERVAPSRVSVLIQGESGVGKERVAAALHKASDRAEGPFVAVNCAAVPENLIESEFFGHEAGAFTGANKRRAGCFETADRGTLFLDEVGEMDLSLQAKLLRVLQEGEIVRVGASKPRRVDVRVVAATNRDLRDRVRQGAFREDLLFRLEVMPLTVPPLRERTEDIVPLAERFLAGRKTLSPGARKLLEQHPWPGNVRELQNAMQRVGLMASGVEVSEADLATWLGGPANAAQPRVAARSVPERFRPRTLRDIEDEAIVRTLEANDGNKTRTARILGIGVRTLFNRLKDLEHRRAPSETVE